MQRCVDILLDLKPPPSRKETADKSERVSRKAAFTWLGNGSEAPVYTFQQSRNPHTEEDTVKVRA